MIKIINFLKDSLIVFLFLLFLERCFALKIRHLLIYILSTTFGYYFGYRFGQRLRHTQAIDFFKKNFKIRYRRNKKFYVFGGMFIKKKCLFGFQHMTVKKFRN